MWKFSNREWTGLATEFSIKTNIEFTNALNDNTGAIFYSRVFAPKTDVYTLITSGDSYQEININGLKVEAPSINVSRSGTTFLRSGDYYDFLVRWNDGVGDDRIKIEWKYTNQIAGGVIPS